jgi:hypothetical protein
VILVRAGENGGKTSNGPVLLWLFQWGEFSVWLHLLVWQPHPNHRAPEPHHPLWMGLLICSEFALPDLLTVNCCRREAEAESGRCRLCRLLGFRRSALLRLCLWNFTHNTKHQGLNQTLKPPTSSSFSLGNLTQKSHPHL